MQIVLISIQHRPHFSSKGNVSNTTFQSNQSDVTKGSRIPEATPQEVVKRLSKEINQFIEESSLLLQNGEHYHALQKAQGAVEKEKILFKVMNDSSLSKQQGQSLAFATMFHLAKVYEQNGKTDDAIEIYESLTKQKKFKAYVAQIRISMGNLYSVEGNHAQAIRMYRMALDQTSRNEKEMKRKLMLSIGISFVHLGKLNDATKSFEDAVELKSDSSSFFNLLSSYVKVGDEEKSKQTLFRMISATRKIQCHENEKGDKNMFDKDFDNCTNRNDDNIALLHDAARLVAKISIEEDCWVDNFLWVHDQLYQKFPQIAFRIEIERSMEHLKRGEYQAAVKIFKTYENENLQSTAMVATNLSFIYFHEGNYTTADDYADIALTSNKYNSNLTHLTDSKA